MSAEIEQVIKKTAFLSYYISMYNTVSDDIGFDKYRTVSADEIYDFMQDLRYEISDPVPEMTKDDVIFCLYVLSSVGICRLTSE
ncbi:MAG TPA: hypothetical protein VNI77_07160 [Nitrososphaera sp.]|nr:hypothetical protein [Nitrososphaera sp.]